MDGKKKKEESMSGKVGKMIQVLREGETRLLLNLPSEEQLEDSAEALCAESFPLKSLQINMNRKSEYAEETIRKLFEGISRCTPMPVLKLFLKVIPINLLKELLEQIRKRRVASEISVEFESSEENELMSTLASSMNENEYVRKLELSQLKLVDTNARKIAEIVINSFLKDLAILAASDEACSKSKATIFKAVEESRSLECFSIECCNVQDCFLLESNKRLRKLSLSESSFGENDLKRLAHFLAHENSLSELNLGDCELKERIFSILEILQEKKNFQSLDIRNNKLCGESAGKLAKFIQRNEHITDLNLGSNFLGKDAGLVIEAIRKNKTLTKIDLSDNFLKEEHAEKISEMLTQNRSITEIHMDDNNLEAGTLKIVSSLKENTNLRVANFAACVSEYEGPKKELAELLEKNQVLTDLNLSFNSISEEEGNKIFESLCHNNSLKKLSVSYNFNSAVMDSLCKMIRSNSSLKEISTFVLLYLADGQKLLDSLSENSSLTKLDFHYSPNAKHLRGKVERQLLLNRRWEEMDREAKVVMMLLQRRRGSNLISQLPRRLLIYLLRFLDCARVDKYKSSAKLLF